MQLYDKITPFPHILAARCEAPCEGACKLCSLGEGISVRELEAAGAAWGEPPRKKAFLRKKTVKAAVFGTDLFSLFLAGELAKKMYPVTVYCQYPDREALLAAVAPDAGADLARLDIKFEWRIHRRRLRVRDGSFRQRLHPSGGSKLQPEHPA